MNTDYDDLRVLPDGTHTFHTDQGKTFVFSTIRNAGYLVDTSDAEVAREVFDRETDSVPGDIHVVADSDPNFRNYPSVAKGLSGVQTDDGAHVFYSSAAEMAVYVPPESDATISDVGTYLDDLIDENEIKELLDISGVGPDEAAALQNAGYYTAEDVRHASQSDLSKNDGIGNALAARIKADVGDAEDEDDDDGLGVLFS